MSQLITPRLTIFPDGQPHVNIGNQPPGTVVDLVQPIRSPVELVTLLAASNAIWRHRLTPGTLSIPYLMGARSDRVMVSGDSVDLEVVADAINSCGFGLVRLFDPHSDAATLLIRNSVAVDNRALVTAYDRPDAVLVCPDAGAFKKVDRYLQWNPQIKEVVHCVKKRDLSNGRITLQVLNPEVCSGRNVVIIDDICDGGATFLAIASQTQAAHKTLIVSHGIFSKGPTLLGDTFDSVITSDSFQTGTNYPQNFTVIPVNFQ